MYIKTIAVSTLLLVSASTVIAAPANVRDELVSTQNTSELRLKNSPVTMTKVGQTGGNYFPSATVNDNLSSHYINHR